MPERRMVSLMASLCSRAKVSASPYPLLRLPGSKNLRIILLVRDYLQVVSILVSQSLKCWHLALSVSIPILSVISVPDLGLS